MYITEFPEDICSYIILQEFDDKTILNLLGINKCSKKLIKNFKTYHIILNEAAAFHKERITQHKTILNIRTHLISKETDYRSQQIYLGYIEDTLNQIDRHENIYLNLTNLIKCLE